MRRLNTLLATLLVLLALAFAAPALGAGQQSTDRLDQRLERGVPAHALQLGSNPSPHAASERSAVCHAAMLVHNSDCGLSRIDDIASKTGLTRREVEEAIHNAKTNLPRGGARRNPDVLVDPATGEIFPKLPNGTRGGDSIGNIFD